MKRIWPRFNSVSCTASSIGSKGLFGLFILGLLIVFVPCINAWADNVSAQGIAAYKQKKYAVAEKYLRQSLQNATQQDDHQTAEALFYLGLTYARTERLNEARRTFEQVIQRVPETDLLAKKARNNITYITSAQMVAVNSAANANQIVKTTMSQGGQNNYLANALFNGRVVRFDAKKMPLKIYIESGSKVPGWTPQYKQVVTIAMSSWQQASAGRIRFMSTTKPDNADIIVRWQKNFQDNLLGVSPFQVLGNTIVRSDVTLALNFPETNKTIPMTELQAITIHELGHAIGIKGHSPYSNDIMYFSRNGHQPNRLSSRDINTIKLLYKTAADVQNSSTMSTSQTQKYLDLFNKGLTAHKAGDVATAMQLYRQAIGVGKTAPEAKFNLSVILINEGGKLAGKGNLTQAAAYYQEAETLLSSVSSSGSSGAIAQGMISSSDVAKNLDIARRNLQIVQSRMQ